MDEAPVFRATKKRKFARSRNTQADENVDVDVDINLNKSLPEQLAESIASSDEVNISNLLKLRKQNRQRNTGVQFSQQKRIEDDDDGLREDMALATIDPAEERLRNISNRFVGSTGPVVDVDKHMFVPILSLP